MKPLLNKNSEKQLQQWLDKPGHGILLAGRPGHNQSAIAEWLALEVTDNRWIITLDNETIGIEDIRQIRHLLQQKQGSIKRVISIPHAESITKEAQNSLLKILEEPPQGVFFVLACERVEELLPTIRSRLIKIDILPLNRQQMSQSESGTYRGLSNAGWDASHGLVQYNADKEIMDLAKKFSAATPFSRLTMIESIEKDRHKAAEFISSLLMIYDFLRNKSLRDNKQNHLQSFIRKEEILLQALERIDQNVNVRSILCYVSLTV